MRVAVWGTGSVGRPAIRSVIAHPRLDLSHVIVNSPHKDGLDAGEIAHLNKCGILATRDYASVIADKPDAIVYAASAEARPMEALQDLLACLSGGVNVVSTSFYHLSYPGLTPEPILSDTLAACREGQSSLFVNGIDPGWALDSLPFILTGVGAGIKEVRCLEIFNYATYDRPDDLRNIIGFGQSMETTPLMLTEAALQLVWAPMIRLLADRLELEIKSIQTIVERRPLTDDVAVPGLGVLEKGTQGAFRFEVLGHTQSSTPIVIEHVTRIDDSCAPDWPYPPEGAGCHQIQIKGQPNIFVTIHAEDPVEEGPAAGGNATAANRLVNAIPAVCSAQPGILTAIDLPHLSAAEQMSA